MIKKISMLFLTFIISFCIYNGDVYAEDFQQIVCEYQTDELENIPACVLTITADGIGNITINTNNCEDPGMSDEDKEEISGWGEIIPTGEYSVADNKPELHFYNAYNTADKYKNLLFYDKQNEKLVCPEYLSFNYHSFPLEFLNSLLNIEKKWRYFLSETGFRTELKDSSDNGKPFYDKTKNNSDVEQKVCTRKIKEDDIFGNGEHNKYVYYEINRNKKIFVATNRTESDASKNSDKVDIVFDSNSKIDLDYAFNNCIDSSVGYECGKYPDNDQYFCRLMLPEEVNNLSKLQVGVSLNVKAETYKKTTCEYEIEVNGINRQFAMYLSAIGDDEGKFQRIITNFEVSNNQIVFNQGSKTNEQLTFAGNSLYVSGEDFECPCVDYSSGSLKFSPKVGDVCSQGKSSTSELHTGDRLRSPTASGSVSFKRTFGTTYYNCQNVLGNLANRLQDLFNIFKIAAPILVIIFSSFDFAKVILNGDEDAIKKSYKKLVKRLILAVTLFFLPFLINLFLRMIPDFSVEDPTCGISKVVIR